MKAKSKFITEEDRALFRAFTETVQPLPKKEVIHLQPKPHHRVTAPLSTRKTQEHLFFFSDHYQYYTNTSHYCRDNTSSAEMKKLTQGFYHPEIELDLHGYTQQQAKIKIAQLVTFCQKKQLYCACIIHGHGKNILKRSIPNWLIQHPKILAFQRAPRKYGGDAALLILIELAE